MGKVWLVFGVLVILGVAAVESANAPAPAVDCSSVIMNMVDCLSFVSNGSKETKPQSTCCSGLKTVLKTSTECLCDAFKNSAQYGIALNMTKALNLPSACGVSASASKCGAQPPALSPKSAKSPAATPAKSPAATPAKSPAATPAKSPAATPAKSPAATPAKSPAATPSGSAPSGAPSGSITAETPAGSITAETPAPAPEASSASPVLMPFMLLFSVAIASCSVF
ncbi:hypothetical protein NE237_016780 [Protea cynaroides]|uniref:Bifunctional inhibitor/plant lipid transfer protein/seed storage helical domain-containing protein n=1 Tax=Protea cynaroides TaxID=273540 RepID=A0A9Q0HGP4_9MAGN|nr:hypothetical protein NE237_016780 [Protea cynaroides]